jgi:hypothetical protein
MNVAYKVVRIDGGVIVLFDSLGNLSNELEFTLFEELNVPAIKIGDNFVLLTKELLLYMRENNKLYVLLSPASEYDFSDWKGAYQLDEVAVGKLLALFELEEKKEN